MQRPGGHGHFLLLTFTTSINLCEGNPPGMYVFYSVPLPIGKEPRHVSGVWLSKFMWLYLRAVIISLLLDMHLLLFYCCFHPISTTQRRKDSFVTQFRAFTSCVQKSVVQQSAYHVRLESWKLRKGDVCHLHVFSFSPLF